MQPQLFIFLLAGLGSAQIFGPKQHPLDPLTAAEIRSAVRIIQDANRGVDLVFHSIILQEPPKSQLLSFFLQNRDNFPTIPRKAMVVVRIRNSITPNQLVVNLSSRRVESLSQDNGQVASFTLDEMFATEQVVKDDPVIKQRCEQAGFPNMSLVEATSWPMGYIKDRPEYAGRRLAMMFMFGRNHEKDNANAHPFDFLPIVDIIQKKIIAIEELPTQSSIYDDGTNKENVSTPKAEQNYDPDLLGRNYFRRDLKPVKTSQNGVSYTINGNEVQWQKFKFRLGFNGREGLVLYWVSYNDNSTVRPLFYRMSMSEMFVPYADPRTPYSRRTAFDEGQYGLGYLATSLRAGEDCLGNVRLMDATLHNEKGEVKTLQGAVCIREEDAGIGWKHVNMRTGVPYITRRQRLAVTFIATIGHYDYIYTWHFYQDATIEFNVKLSGILSVNLLAKGANPAGHGTEVDEQIDGAYHQHYFALRVDPEVDGNKNTVVMEDVVQGMGGTGTTTNKYGNGFLVNRTIFKTAAESRTNVNSKVRRAWVISNKEGIDKDETSVGWILKPAASPMLMLQDDSPLLPAGGFTKYNTWVTKYNDSQLYAAGVYQNGEVNDGLPEWVDSDPNANIENQDVVLWHVFDAAHIPRKEDWPVMPIEDVTVMLKPYNFFRLNPALDVPQVQRENRYRQN